MTRAVTLANLADQNIFSVDGVNDRVGIGSTTPTTKLDVNGTVTATSFVGDGTGITGVASTDFIVTGTAATFTGGITANQSDISVRNLTGVAATFTGDVSVRNLTGVAATFTGVLTYEDVTNIDSIGIVTARSGIKIGPSVGVAGTFAANGSYVTAGIITASSFVGSGASLTGISSWEVFDTWLYGGG